MNDNINRLLKQYEKPTLAERYSTEYKRRQKQQQRIKNRHLLLDALLNEVPFTLPKSEINIIHYLINTIPDIKVLHRQASNEVILLAMIFLMRTLRKPKTNVDEYSISKKHGLNNTNFRLILCRLNREILEHNPLMIRETRKDNYQYLEKSDK